MIERDFALDMVITSHDPMRWNFSDSTSLSEALIIATRRPSQGGSHEHRVNFVNLWQNPDGVLDAHRLAQAIVDTSPVKIEDTGTALLEVDGVHVGESVPYRIQNRGQAMEGRSVRPRRLDTQRNEAA